MSVYTTPVNTYPEYMLDRYSTSRELRYNYYHSLYIAALYPKLAEYIDTYSCPTLPDIRYDGLMSSTVPLLYRTHDDKKDDDRQFSKDLNVYRYSLAESVAYDWLTSDIAPILHTLDEEEWKLLNYIL